MEGLQSRTLLSRLTKSMLDDSNIIKREKRDRDVSIIPQKLQIIFSDREPAVEEKYKNQGADEDDESSSDEEEDENGFLATEDLDAQISATLQAIKSKDPRVYDGNTTFYKPDEENETATKEKKEKPFYLQDYHREKLMRGDVGDSDEEEEKRPQTYAQEQESLRKAFIDEFKASKAGDESDSDSDDGFLKPKEKAAAVDSNGVHPSRAKAVKMADLDVKAADRDPETYLSNFMSARAWVEESGTGWKAFESDDGEDDNGADEFEQAYNMRFEDPEKSNEVLKSYSRDLTNSRSVRREDKSGRKRKREEERERKEEERRQRHEEKARLKKLRLEEAEEKLRKIKQAAGAVGKQVKDKEWIKFLDEAWENDEWETAMQKRFGEDYYAMGDAEAAASDDEGASSSKKSKPKKPTWDDDIDIGDIVPEFDEEETKAAFALSDNEEMVDADNRDEEDGEEESAAPKKRKAADHKRARLESQREARKERTQLEALVESKMELDDHDILGNNTGADVQPFRYRETSPQAFGMTARDILLAPSDQVLNEFVGLKKLASFRDVEKKRKDKKRLNKKARLREWRRGAFGREFESSGPTWGFEGRDGENVPGTIADDADNKKHGKDDGEARSKKRRKRSKSTKTQSNDE